jgi:hypothetical protein
MAMLTKPPIIRRKASEFGMLIKDWYRAKQDAVKNAISFKK